MAFSIRATSVLFLAIISSNVVNAQVPWKMCYWPDQTSIASTNTYEMTPCFSGDSQCCKPGDACMSNGLCFSADNGMIYRGACTVKDWNTPQCAKYCNKITPRLWSNIFTCSWSQARGWKHWCGNSDNVANICNADGSNGEFITWPKGTVPTVVPLPGVTSDAPAPSATAVEKAEFHWRFYNDFGCNPLANPKDTWPNNGSPAGDGQLSKCFSSPAGVVWKGLSIDVLFRDNQAWGIQTFCNASCTGTASIKQQNSNCFYPTQDCSIASFKVIS